MLKLLVSAVLVLCWDFFFLYLVLAWGLLCFCFCAFFFSFHVFYVLLYTVWFLSSASAFVILHPELQLPVCACLIHSIGEEREKKGVEMGHALFLSSLVSNAFLAFPRKILYNGSYWKHKCFGKRCVRAGNTLC